MKIFTVSDIHVEFGGYSYTPPDCDVLALLGDLGERQNGVKTVFKMAKLSTARRIFWVPLASQEHDPSPVGIKN